MFPDVADLFHEIEYVEPRDCACLGQPADSC
jgi:hypothetical protein